MTRVSADYREQLQALRKLYLEQLPHRIKAIEETLDRLGRDGWSKEGLESLHLLAHRLAGSAGIYDVDVLGAAADRLETAVRTILDGPEPRAAFQDRLAMLVGDLARACPGTGLRARRRSSSHR